MPHTTLCPKCGVVLNLPDGVEGRRLRCPRCGERFQVGPAPGSPPPARPRPPSTGAEPANRRPTSSLMLTESGESDMPRADRDLRETFAPELLLGEDEPGGRPGKPAAPSSGGVPMADAAALFDDQAGAPPRKRKNLAEARSKPRRCPDCGGVVPAGMSLCGHCGLDLDTGQRPVMEEIFDAAPITRRKEAAPLGILVTGSTVLLASAILTLLALVQSLQPQDEGEGLLSRQKGFLSLALVGSFCVYAAVQFLRGRSVKLMIVALLLGAVVNMIGLIGLPIYQAMDATVPAAVGPVGLDDEGLPPIRNVAQELDSRKITWGIAILLCEAAALVYLMSPTVRRHFEHKAVTTPVAVT